MHPLHLIQASMTKLNHQVFVMIEYISYFCARKEKRKHEVTCQVNQACLMHCALALMRLRLFKEAKISLYSA